MFSRIKFKAYNNATLSHIQRGVLMVLQPMESTLEWVCWMSACRYAMYIYIYRNKCVQCQWFWFNPVWVNTTSVVIIFDHTSYLTFSYIKNCSYLYSSHLFTEPNLFAEFPVKCHLYVPRLKTPSLPYYLPIAGGRIIGFIPFPRVLVLCEMQSVSSRIWTRVAVSIPYDDNHYTTGTSSYLHTLIWCIYMVLYSI